MPRDIDLSFVLLGAGFVLSFAQLSDLKIVFKNTSELHESKTQLDTSTDDELLRRIDGLSCVSLCTSAGDHRMTNSSPVYGGGHPSEKLNDVQTDRIVVFHKASSLSRLFRCRDSLLR